MNELQLRLATKNDAAILLQWRNDEVTRIASRNREPVTDSEHQDWLARSLQNERRQIQIGEIEGQPIGTVRTDRHDNGEIEISWTISPEMRGKGLGTRIVQVAIEPLKGKLVAYIRADNLASQKIAINAGFAKADSEPENDMLRFELLQ